MAKFRKFSFDHLIDAYLRVKRVDDKLLELEPVIASLEAMLRDAPSETATVLRVALHDERVLANSLKLERDGAISDFEAVGKQVGIDSIALFAAMNPSYVLQLCREVDARKASGHENNH